MPEPQERNPFELAGASQPAAPEPPPNLDEAREVFPVRFEKDFAGKGGIRDFGHVERVEEVHPERLDEAPKVSPAPESVMSPSLPTGLEDVSSADLETSVQPSAEKDTQLMFEMPSSTSDNSTPAGKSEPTVETSTTQTSSSPTSQT